MSRAKRRFMGTHGRVIRRYCAVALTLRHVALKQAAQGRRRVSFMAFDGRISLLQRW
jgi:hypothetical protein